MKRLLAAVAMLLLLPARVSSQGAGQDLLLGQSWSLSRPSSDAAQLQRVAAAALPDGKAPALEVTVSRAFDPPWAVQLGAPLGVTPKPGDRLRFSFWARASAGNWLRAVIETAGSPWTAVEQATLKIGPQWEAYSIEETVSQDYGQPLVARLQLGASPGSLQFARLKAEDLGPDPGFVLAQGAVEPDAVRERIRRHRMGELSIRVVDLQGRPVQGARIGVAMQRHAFLFGCNAFGLNPVDSSPAAAAYRDRFAALFNYATLPFYWASFEPEPGKPQFARREAMADWCDAHGIATKAHPLIWHETYPAWAPADPDAAIPLLHGRVEEIVGREHSRIRYYDVVNEASVGAWSHSPANGESRWIRRDGPSAVVETALRWAREAEDGASDTLIYNDYETGPANVALLKRMQQDGALPDAIGIQSHMHAGVWPLERVWQVCETFSQFGRPIHFTETTVLSGPKRRDPPFHGPPASDWNTTPEGERSQADYVVRLYSLLFSHPAVRAITWWDFSDQSSWMGAPAGLVRKDMLPKPSYDRLMQLIHHDWWTDAAGWSDAAGLFETRAFYGDYAITADDGHGHEAKRSASFPEGSGREVVTLQVGSVPREVE